VLYATLIIIGGVMKYNVKVKSTILPVLVSLILLCVNTISNAQDISDKRQIKESNNKYRNIEISILGATITGEKKLI